MWDKIKGFWYWCFTAILLVITKAYKAIRVCFIDTFSKAWKAFKIGFMKVGFQVYFRTRYYKNWSRLYRLAHERGKKADVITFRRMTELVDFIQTKMVYVHDSWEEMWDAIASPEHVQWAANNSIPVGDCDEFAIYTSTAMQKSMASGDWKDDLVANYLLTVTWAKADGKLGGHNMNLMRRVAEGQLEYCYMDYGFPTAWDTMPNTLAKVRSRYFPGGTVCGWAICDLDLNPIEIHSNF